VRHRTGAHRSSSSSSSSSSAAAAAEGAVGISEDSTFLYALSLDSSLEVLELRHNHLGTASLLLLITSLKHNGTLKRLDLRGNAFDFTPPFAHSHTHSHSHGHHRDVVASLQSQLEEIGYGIEMLLDIAISHRYKYLALPAVDYASAHQALSLASSSSSSSGSGSGAEKGRAHRGSSSSAHHTTGASSAIAFFSAASSSASSSSSSAHMTFASLKRRVVVALQKGIEKGGVHLLEGIHAEGDRYTAALLAYEKAKHRYDTAAANAAAGLSARHNNINDNGATSNASSTASLYPSTKPSQHTHSGNEVVLRLPQHVVPRGGASSAIHALRAQKSNNSNNHKNETQQGNAATSSNFWAAAAALSNNAQTAAAAAASQSHADLHGTEYTQQQQQENNDSYDLSSSSSASSLAAAHVADLLQELTSLYAQLKSTEKSYLSLLKKSPFILELGGLLDHPFPHLLTLQKGSLEYEPLEWQEKYELLNIISRLNDTTISSPVKAVTHPQAQQQSSSSSSQQQAQQSHSTHAFPLQFYKFINLGQPLPILTATTTTLVNSNNSNSTVQKVVSQLKKNACGLDYIENAWNAKLAQQRI
jgi:hypothetical protein